VHSFERIAKDALRCRRVHEVILVRTGTEHVGVVQHVQVRRATSGVLRRRSINVDDALLGFLNAGKLVADRIVTNELDANFTVCPLFQIADKL